MFDSFSELYADQLKLITDALDQAGINNVLWGHVIERFLEKSVSSGIECIIHDGMAEKACQTLLAAGLEPCKYGEDCPATRHWQDRPDAVAHVHFEATTLGCNIPVMFWEKSSLFWAFPDLPSSPPSSDDPYYMPIRIPWTYYDSRSQRPPIDLTPARMIIPVKIVEALIWLMCRTGILMRDWKGGGSIGGRRSWNTGCRKLQVLLSMGFSAGTNCDPSFCLFGTTSVVVKVNRPPRSIVHTIWGSKRSFVRKMLFQAHRNQREEQLRKLNIKSGRSIRSS
ncbi:hypothetical protein ASPTUDRAFT_70100 [Aspergillus tubingensis CBS 134.48]|uniref:Uncharacterized protein n=1 Tax=Aspergillus tubingensis (strain CBS 134.48) TaxID=767770 RepID=A0A1L9NJN7_ASPTC|nr:hypothetical protein ASPTUDRAFT_70100 [Aspergillus tubingensis CBS 134.48]